MKLRLLGLLLLSQVILFGSASAALPPPVYSIDASTLPAGSIASGGIANTGSAGGLFTPLYVAPIVERVNGRMAISFTGKNGLQASVVAPANIVSEHAWSVSAWLYNPTINDLEFFLQWNNINTGNNTGTRAQFGYGQAWNQGLFAGGGGADQSWGRMPVAAPGQWHHFCYTWSGNEGTMIIYVDGKPVSAEVNKWLIVGGVTGATIAAPRVGYIYTGANNFSGSIASLSIYDQELAPTDVLALAGASAPTGSYLFDPAFEFNSGTNNYANGMYVPPFDKDGVPIGSYTGWTLGGDSNTAGAWNTGSQNMNGGDTNNPGTGLGTVYRYAAVSHPGGPKYNTGYNQNTLVDGVGIVNMEVGGTLTYASASYPALAVNGRVDSTEWSQPIWGIDSTKAGTPYHVWGFFSPTRTNANSNNYVAYATIKVDNTYVFRKQKVYCGNSGSTFVPKPFQRVEGSFVVPSTGAKVFSVMNEGKGSAYNTPTTSGSLSFTESNMLIVDKVGIAVENSAPKPTVVWKYAAYGEKQVFFGGVQSDPPSVTSSGGGNTQSASFTLSNDGGLDMQITRISVTGNGSDQFYASASNKPDPANPSTFITIPAYGGLKTVSLIFAPTRNGVYNVNAVVEGQYYDPEGNLHVLQPLQVPMYGYSKQMIYNNSFELPHNIVGEGNNLLYCPGWAFTRVAQTANVSNYFAITTPGNWPTWNGTSGALSAYDGSGLKLKDGIQLCAMRNGGYIQQVIPGFQSSRTYRFVFWVTSGQGSSVPWSAKLIKHGTSVTSTVIASNVLPVWPSLATNKTLTRFDADFGTNQPGSWDLRVANDRVSSNNDFGSILNIDLIKLYQYGSPSVAYTTTTAINFGEVQKGDLATSRVLCIANDGGSTLTVTGVTLAGANATEFDLLDNQGRPVNLPFKIPAFYMTTNTLVRCKSASEGAKSAQITIATLAGGNLTVDLSADTPTAPYVVNGGMEFTVPNIHDLSRYNVLPPVPPSPDNVNQGYVNSQTAPFLPLGWSGYVGKTDTYVPGIRTTVYDNGIGEGTFAFDIRKTATETTKTIYQWVPGFRAGRSYHISAKLNSRSGQKGTAFIRLGGVTIASMLVNPVDASGIFNTPFRTLAPPADFTPTVDCKQLLEVGIANSTTADELLIDDVRVQEVNAKVAVDQTSLRFPDLVVRKQDGTNYSWFYPPTMVYLKITNVGYNTALHFTGTGTGGHPGLTLSGDPAFQIVSVTPDSTADLAVGQSLEVALRFNPDQAGASYHTLAKNIAGSLVITTNDPNYPSVTVPLAANKVPVELGSFNVE